MSMHILRNPHGYSDDEVRAARLWAGDEIEQLRRAIKEIGSSVEQGDDKSWVRLLVIAALEHSTEK